ncbi:hypothetical protein OUZ56_013030 [Daphnia magna]|uniref:Peptidase M14 domain-containing protein n=1 Tax=Daphnia magna TaxID=35525 RepID=A0ABQ9Z4Q2_9CRUS|nr:hypothetical protein OUZ56_013030 [Daphnia magna]
MGKSSQIKRIKYCFDNNGITLQLYLTLHSYGQFGLLPYGYDVVYPSDYNDLLALANNAASKFVNYRYTVGNTAALLYAASGGSADWVKSIGIKYSYTFELPDRGTNAFTLPASEILPVCQDFFPALDVFATKVATCCGAFTTTTTKPLTTRTTRPTTTTKRTTTKCPCTCG